MFPLVMNRVLKSDSELCVLPLWSIVLKYVYFVELNFWHNMGWEHSNVRPIGGIFGGFYYFFYPKSHSVINEQLIFCCSWAQILAETRRDKCDASNIDILWFIKWWNYGENRKLYSSVLLLQLCDLPFALIPFWNWFFSRIFPLQ